MRIRTLTVSELNKYVKKLLNCDPILNNISVKGEISNLKFHGNGHVY
ncbi:MAG TPA: exodeoxyribonuclease VII large subunit, partial [Clostridiales bacterium]|nr:exodeoxyribonuclease VII large subunit [Clostridiales bacterium]